MPDLDSPQITGILEQGTPTSGVVVGLHLSKRPRDDASPPRGKRGRGENVEKLTLQIPSLTSSPSIPCGNGSAQVPAPLCESPIANQAPPTSASTIPHFVFTSTVLGDDGTAKLAEKSVEDTALSAIPSATPGGSGFAVAKRKPLIAATAAPSVGATDPIFHAAILRVSHRRSGNMCPEAKGWRWSGGYPVRFNHWPNALHPAVMDLLANVSAGEERVVLAGCDARVSGCRDDDEQTKQLTPPLLPPPPPPVRRMSSWRAPVPCTPVRRGSTAGPEMPLPATPMSHPRAAVAGSVGSGLTPLSALRRPGSARRSSGNRVRFSTHDMSVVDTPDPARDGSEKSMVSALEGLQSILTAAERVQILVARGRSNSGVELVEARTGGRHYEGYFDRFGATVSRDAEEHAEDGALSPEDNISLTSISLGPSSSNNGEKRSGENSGRRSSITQAEKRADSSLQERESSALEDAVALVSVLKEIASSDSAPEEVELAGGWGPEHSNAAAFYSTELASLCGLDPSSPVAKAGAVGSHLRARYLDVLSCLIRYNLKLLLNVCLCEGIEAQAIEGDDESMESSEMEDEEEENQEEGAAESRVTESGGHSDTEELSPSPPPVLTVVLPEKFTAGTANSWESPTTAQAERGCGCVTVLDGTGALEFNTEDVAALLTLALGRVRPFVPLEARVAAAVASLEDNGEEEDHDDGDVVDSRVWAAVLQYASDCRAVVAAGPGHGVSHSGLFPDDSNETVADGSGAADASTAGYHPFLNSDVDLEEQSCLNVDEAADLLEYVAATRFIAQLIAEPVVAAGIGAGRWAATERLAQQIRKLANAEEEAAVWREGVGYVAAPSVSNTLCLGELAGVQALGVRMAQQARYAPALEARLRGELRRALRRGLGSRQRRLKSRLVQTALPDVFSFPMVAPCCNLAPGRDAM